MPIKDNFKNLTDGYQSKPKTEIVYSINENPAPGTCRLQINEFQCGVKAKTRGLCSTHYQRFLAMTSRKTLDTYALPLKEK